MAQAHPSALEAFQTIEADFFRDAPQAYLAALIALGYDGAAVPRPDGLTHHLVYDPAAITIVARHPIAPESRAGESPESDAARPARLRA